MAEQTVDFRTVDRGYQTLAAAEAAISGPENAGKFATSIQGGVAWFSANVDGVVSSVPDLRATCQNLQEQINGLTSGSTLVNFRVWDESETYIAGRLRAYPTTSGIGVFQSQQNNNIGHNPLADDGTWWLQIAVGTTVVGDLFEWLSMGMPPGWIPTEE